MEQILSKIIDWNQRKKALIAKQHVELAYYHLNEYGRTLNFA